MTQVVVNKSEVKNVNLATLDMNMKRKRKEQYCIKNDNGKRIVCKWTNQCGAELVKEN